MNETKTSQQEATSVLQMKGTCIEFFSAYQEMDIERMLNLCTPESIVYFEPLDQAGTGLVHELGKNIWTALMDCFPDLDNTVTSLEWIEAQHAVKCRVSIFGTQRKDFAGIPAHGLRFDSEHIFIFKFDDLSHVTELRVLWDHDKFVQQLTPTVL
ncbi:nuclear transport factor 2 family protein [Dawidia soli]|uniref:Ester cyclase n=1 Tax=Dawidia soli TaxID=2782352 RepID=A0AAP2GFT6_9BACT|nr:nuclear transport factor 2 family protein [Dawidia soli]MBT1689809.1 ester cyclase [Dawidia soli]